MGKENMAKGFEAERRKYSHNEIADICREEFLRIHDMDGPIYDFAQENEDKETTDEELRAKFAAMFKKEK